MIIYIFDKLFDLYYGVKDATGAIITPGVIDGYGTKDAVSDNENFEVFGLINKVDKPNAGDKVFLDVRKITDSNELDDVRSELNNYYLNKSLSFDDKVLTPYDIKLYVKNQSSGNKNFIQPKSGESILVKLELDPLFYYTDFKIYHTTHKDDGTVDEIDSLPLRKDLDLTNNKYYVYFEADSFSTFTITCDAKTIVVSEDGEIDSLTNQQIINSPLVTSFDLLNTNLFNSLIKLKPFAVTLTWNNKNQFGGGAHSTCGLTKFGKLAIKMLEQNGILVDCAHLNRKSFWQFTRLTTKPIFVSHSNLNCICSHKRNLTNKQIEFIAKSGGYVGLTLYQKFILEKTKQYLEDKNIKVILPLFLYR